MQTMSVVNRFTNYSKLFKLNVMLMVLLLVVTTISVSNATDNTPDPECGAQVALVLDRSSSIGVDSISGGAAQSQANIAAIKTGSNAFIGALQGPDSFIDVYAFSSVAQRINTGGWFNLNNEAAINSQRNIINGIRFKQGATPSTENAYDDGLGAASEGLTNWEDALESVRSTRNDPVPSHLVVFTDGNPTTNIEYAQRAIDAGGNYVAAGLPTSAGVDQIDIDRALAKADQVRQGGTQIVPIAIGATEVVNTANLQALAGPGNPIYTSNNYSDLTNLFLEAAANICVEPPAHSKVLVNAVDEQGNLLGVPVNVTTDRTVDGPENGEQKTTSTNSANPWSAEWAFQTDRDWRAQIAATQTPPGYEAVSDSCKLGEWSTGGTGITQVEGSASDPLNAILDPIAKGSNVYCQFVFKKLVTPNPTIELEKTGPNVARAGESVTYTFTVKNTGNTELRDIVITDETLSEFTDQPVEISVPGTLQPGQTSSPVTYDFTIPADFEGESFVNVANVVAVSVNPNTGQPNGTVQDEDDHTISLIDWSVTKAADKTSVVPGETVTYTITVTNNGGAALTNLEVSDPTINFPENGVPEVIAVLLPGESKSFTVEYVIPIDYEGDTFTNVALVCLPLEGQDDECREPEVTVEVNRPSISIEKTASAESASEGDTVTYTFLITNTSSLTIFDIEVIDNVLGDLGSIEKLEPGETVTKTVDYVIPVGSALAGTITNVVTACFATPVWEDNCATDDHNLSVVAVGPGLVERPVVGGASLPFTGSSSNWLATLAATLLGLGTALFAASRRRRELA